MKFIGVVILIAGALSAGAANYTWNGGSGSFQTSANWTPSVVPGSADTAIFSTAGTYDVTFGGAVTNAGATVGASAVTTDVTFDLNGHPWYLSGALSLAGTGTARFGGGSLTVGSSVTVASDQKLVLDSGSTWFRGSQLGTSNGGAIEVNGGTNVLAWAMPLHAAPNGGASLRLTGGSLTLTNATDGSRFQLYDGAKASLESGLFSVGTTMDIYGTRVNPGVLDICTNATMICTGWGITISRSNGGLGIVNIDGGTLAISNAGMTVVSCSGATSVTTGLVNLVDGTIYLRWMNLAATTNGVGILHQTGGQLRILNDTSFGQWGCTHGILSVEGGTALFNGKLYLGKATNAVGTINVSGGTLTASGDFVLGSYLNSTGDVNVTGGTLVSGGNTVIGSAAGSVGNVVLSGGTNRFLNTVTVGSMGSGNLAFAGGLQLGTNTLLNVADQLGSTGSLEISGGTNLFRNMTFGIRGTATVKISGGYTWTTNRLVVGNSAGSTGRVELTGGILAVSTIDGRDPTLASNPGGISSILFDGGTLQHAWYLSDFKDRMLNGFGSATLTDRGLIVDTAGGIRTIDQVLEDEAGYAGSLTKRGEGKLTLSVNDSFTGRVSVEQGELAVSSGGAIYMCGGVAIDAGAFLNLASAGALRQTVTASGTVSRIDGALTMKSDCVLTNGVGATMGGSGVVTGSLVFVAGSFYGRSPATDTGPLTVTGDAIFQRGVSVALTGYTTQQLEAGIPLITSDSLQTPGKIPVTLDGAAHPYWWAVVPTGSRTLTARLIRTGTIITLL